jgi:ferric iron reductase protein FhuF
MTGAVSLVDRITDTVDYLRVSVAPTDGDWIRCEPLVDAPAHLAELVATTKEGRGTDRDDVAMSLFVQGYAFRIASLAIGAWVMGDAVIDIAPANVSIALGRHRPNAVALDNAVLVEVDGSLRALHETLIDDHLARLVECAHRACRVGEALLWGNVAAGCASSFGAFSTELVARRIEIRDKADAFFESARPEVRGAGKLVHLRDQWAWERKSCCLWYLTASAFKCEDCSLWTDDERKARYAAAAEDAGA